MSDIAPATPDTTPSAAGDVIGGLSSEARDHWRLTGELPDAEPSSKPSLTPNAESSPAVPAAQDTSTDVRATPASEPGTPKKPNASTRKAEVESEVAALKALLAERHELRQALARDTDSPSQTPKVDSSPTPEKRTLAETLASPDISRPMLSETAFWEQHPEATVGDYAAYIADYKIIAREQQQTVRSERQSRADAYLKQFDGKLAENPAYWDTISPRVRALTPVDLLPAGAVPTTDNVIAQEIITSAVAPALIEHLSSHLDVLTKLQQMPTFAAVVREIGRLEATLERSSVPSAAPAALPVSLAPPPPATLGTKPAQPADELSEAIREGNFTRYRELQNRKDLKSA